MVLKRHDLYFHPNRVVHTTKLKKQVTPLIREPCLALPQVVRCAQSGTSHRRGSIRSLSLFGLFVLTLSQIPVVSAHKETAGLTQGQGVLLGFISVVVLAGCNRWNVYLRVLRPALREDRRTCCWPRYSGTSLLAVRRFSLTA